MIITYYIIFMIWMIRLSILDWNLSWQRTHVVRHDCCYCKLPMEPLVSIGAVAVSLSLKVSDNDLSSVSNLENSLFIAVVFFIFVSVLVSFSFFSLSLFVCFSYPVKWDDDQRQETKKNGKSFRMRVLHIFYVAYK